MKARCVPYAVLSALIVLVGGCVGGSSDDAKLNATPPPVVLTQQSVLGKRRPPGEVRPGVHWVGGKQTYIVIVLTKTEPETPLQISTPSGPVSVEEESRQDGERDKDDNLVTPAMGITETIRLRTPKDVPVLVRKWLAPNDPSNAIEQVLGGTLFKTKQGVYEDLWVQGGDIVLSWRMGP